MKNVDSVINWSEVEKFMSEFGSVCVASVSESGEVSCTYAPFVRCELGNFICVSEVAEHYKNIAANPNNVEILFLEDERNADSAFMRRRLRFQVCARILERGEFESVFSEFEARHGSVVGVIRKMQDFHLVKLDFGKGRLVLGFGKAYDINNGEILAIRASGNPHRG